MGQEVLTLTLIAQEQPDGGHGRNTVVGLKGKHLRVNDVPSQKALLKENLSGASLWPS